MSAVMNDMLEEPKLRGAETAESLGENDNAVSMEASWSE